MNNFYHKSVFCCTDQSEFQHYRPFCLTLLQILYQFNVCSDNFNFLFTGRPIQRAAHHYLWWDWCHLQSERVSWRQHRSTRHCGEPAPSKDRWCWAVEQYSSHWHDQQTWYDWRSSSQARSIRGNILIHLPKSNMPLWSILFLGNSFQFFFFSSFCHCIFRLNQTLSNRDSHFNCQNIWP